MIFVVRVTLWSLELKSLVLGILNIYNAHDSLKGLQSVAAVHRTPSSKYRIFLKQSLLLKVLSVFLVFSVAGIRNLIL